jgi:hypothetical protein
MVCLAGTRKTTAHRRHLTGVPGSGWRRVQNILAPQAVQVSVVIVPARGGGAARRVVFGRAGADTVDPRWQRRQRICCPIRSGRADFMTAEQAGQRMTAAGLSAAPASMVSLGLAGPRRVGRADAADSGARRAKAEAHDGHFSRCPGGIGRVLFRTAAQDGQTIRSADMMRNLCAVSAPRQLMFFAGELEGSSFQRIGRADFSPQWFSRKARRKGQRSGSLTVLRPERCETPAASQEDQASTSRKI